MNIHKDARLTPADRALLVERFLSGESASDIAEAMSVSPTTVYKWVRRWKTEGEKGLRDRSTCPHRSPNRLARHRRRQIERLRRKRWSTPRIARELGMPLSTVGRECRRLGLGRLRNLDPPTPVIRYERDRPGELLHLNTKRFGRMSSDTQSYEVSGRILLRPWSSFGCWSTSWFWAARVLRPGGLASGHGAGSCGP